MKRAVATLSLALLVMPALALADDGPPPPAGPEVSTQNTQMHAEMRQMRAQMEQLHLQARTQILQSLTPAHRQLLANVVGQLAIAATPDREAAARQLNAALSQGEQQSIVRIHESLHTQMKAMMASMRSQMESMHSQMQGTMPGGEPQTHPDLRTAPGAAGMQRPPQDAGHILLNMGEMRAPSPFMMHH
jgi:hypothetical protein